jgi:hypothetical protein
MPCSEQPVPVSAQFSCLPMAEADAMTVSVLQRLMCRMEAQCFDQI